MRIVVTGLAAAEGDAPNFVLTSGTVAAPAGGHGDYGALRITAPIGFEHGSAPVFDRAGEVVGVLAAPGSGKTGKRAASGQDSTALRATILRNLLENALAAVAPIGGGSITFLGRRTQGAVELTVRDSGVGFRPGDAARLFQKFTRLHPGGGGSRFGTGLGLYIVRRLMQLAGGRISAQSAGIGQGATFVLWWPDGGPGDAVARDPTDEVGPLAGREHS